MSSFTQKKKIVNCFNCTDFMSEVPDTSQKDLSFLPKIEISYLWAFKTEFDEFWFWLILLVFKYFLKMSTPSKNSSLNLFSFRHIKGLIKYMNRPSIENIDSFCNNFRTNKYFDIFSWNIFFWIKNLIKNINILNLFIIISTLYS